MDNIRNIAIIAHVDHGKTTLVDQPRRQFGAVGDSALRAPDAAQREKGIMIGEKMPFSAETAARISVTGSENFRLARRPQMSWHRATANPRRTTH